ncbi:SPOR domain-containing protein [Catalinimonas sp. 4WD22]|uniref:SPOR domain-containing protein n=1 Tax=Catalinimonas locisalis TaxID=3133978 RepID=UPI00310178C2
METLAEEYQVLSKKNTALRRYNKQLIYWMRILGFLLLLALGYIIYIEYYPPFFGRWPEMTERYQNLLLKNEKLTSEIDSLNRVNSLLVELSPYYTGVFFEVQIGAFENFDLEKYKDGLAKLNIDYTGEIDQYTLGKFRDLDMAQDFAKDIRKMGIQDAFIVAKVDGKRVTVKEALAEAERLREGEES